MVSTGIGVRQGVDGWDGVAWKVRRSEGEAVQVRLCVSVERVARGRWPTRPVPPSPPTYLRYATPARSHVFGTRSAHKLMMARILFATINSMSCDDSASPMNTPSFSFEAIGNACRFYKPSGFQKCV